MRKGIGFLLIPVYTRYLSPEEYGVLAMLSIVATMAVVLPQSTLGPSLFRSYYDYDSAEGRALVVSTALYLVLLMSGAITIVGCLLSAPLSSIILRDPLYGGLLRVTFVSSFFGSVGVIIFAVFRARKWSKRYTVVSTLSFLVQLVCTIYLVVVLRTGVWGVLMGGLVGSVVTALIMLPLIRNDVRLAISPLEVKKLLGYGFPFVPEGLLAFAISSADRFFLEHYGSLTQVGLYSMGFKFGQIVQFLLFAPLSVVEPAMIFSVEKEADARQFYARLLTYALFVGLWLSLGISNLARDVIRIMATPPFWDAYRVVPLICLYFVLRGVRGLGSVGLALLRKTKYFPIAEAIGASTGVILMFVLVPRYGMRGAGIGMVASYLTVFAFRTLVARRFFVVEYEWVRIGKMIACAIIIYFIASAIVLETVWISIVIKGLLSLSFPLTLYATGFYQEVEKGKLREIAGVLRQRVAVGER